MKVYALSMSNMNLDMVYPLWFTEAQREKIHNDFVRWYIQVHGSFKTVKYEIDELEVDKPSDVINAVCGICVS